MNSDFLSLAGPLFPALLLALPPAAATPGDLVNACMAGDRNQVNTLVEGGESVSEPDSRGYTPLSAACAAGQEDLARYLVEHGADVNRKDERGWSPLAAAVRRGNESLVRYLVGKGASCGQETDGPSPIEVAVVTGNVKIARFLLENGASAQTISYEGMPVFMGACSLGNREMLELLLAHGADIQASTREGRNGMTSACFVGDFETVRWLHDKGLGFDAVDQNGGTCLLFAAMSGNRELVEYLLREGKDRQGRPLAVDTPDSGGNTPLMVLVKRSLDKGLDSEMMNLLLEHGARPDAADRNGETPLGLLKKELELLGDDGKQGDAPADLQALVDDMQQMVKLMEQKRPSAQ